MPWYKSLKIRLTVSLLVLFAVLAGSTYYTLYSVKKRQHDYAILNLAGQLRVITTGLVDQSRNYLINAPRDYETYYRDVRLFHQDLDQQIKAYDEIIHSFQERKLDPEVTGLSTPIACNWDRPSINQLQYTAQHWQQFKQGLMLALGNDKDGPRLEAGAQYVVDNAEMLEKVVYDLSESFRYMMQNKLDGVSMAVEVVMVITALGVLLLLVVIYRQVLRPVALAVDGINRIRDGDIGYRLAAMPDNEIGMLGGAVNEMSQRLDAVFNLTARVNQAGSLDAALKSIYADFNRISPLEWMGLFRLEAGDARVVLERVYANLDASLAEGQSFTSDERYVVNTLAASEPFIIDDISRQSDIQPGSLLAALQQAGICSVVLLPLRSKQEGSNVIVFGSRECHAYTADQLQQIHFIASQLVDSFEKTLVMENLVVSAVEGLAKLAESRDPETGDHLLRMSIYSSIIAAALREEDAYRDVIDSAYVRDIRRFAPMHDIGKVGVEDSILLKPGRLTPEERLEMEKHPVIGANVLRRCEEQMNAVGHSIFQLGIEIAAGHHEKFDGSGYPAGLAGEEIPLSARIVAAADVFDALTSRRPYKEAWPVEKALALLDEESGKHFDPAVIAALKRALPDILAIYDQYKHV